jgi:CRP-like cAMP-binding protein
VADVQTVQELLAANPFFAGLADDALALVAGCATNVHFDPDEYVFREGDPADRFFVVRHGRVALELHAPGSHHVLDTVEDGDVLGWSWLVPPYRWFLDARAVAPTSAIALDGVCLRGKCDADPVLGYALLQRVAHVMYQRLQSSRVRLLDLYGGRRAAAP